jgi:hypothetical protein
MEMVKSTCLVTCTLILLNENALFWLKESPGVWSVPNARRAAPLPLIYVSDYKTAGEIVRVAHTFCFGAYVRFNTVNRFKLCQGCQIPRPVTSPPVQCSARAAGSYAETMVASDTDGGESLTLHVIYQSERDSVTLCT